MGDESGEHKVVLVVDDEAPIRNMVQATLTNMGLAVLSAANGDEALAISRVYTKPIHLLLTDVKMPGMTGLELASIIRKDRPDTRVLIMSGYSSGLISAANEPVDFVRKPFVLQQLRDKIRDVLAKPPQEPEEI